MPRSWPWRGPATRTSGHFGTHVLLDEHDRRAVLRDRRDRLVDLAHHLRREAEADLVAQEKPRLVEQGAADRDIEKHAVAVLAHAMAALGDSFNLRAFASNGREEVRVARIKDFAQPFDRHVLARLSGMSPGLSTRLGAALRHAGAELASVAASRRLLIVLTDGAPSDIDVPDPADLVEDARRAVLGLRSQGIDLFGLTLDQGQTGHGAAVFGRTNHMPVRRIEDLPRRLSELYFRVARR